MGKQCEIPKTLGACVDLLYELRGERLKIQAQADAIEVQEKQLRDHLIHEISANDASGVAGKLARASITVSVEPTAKDWDEIYRYVVEEEDFSLIQRRLNAAACRERWDSGAVIPGVEQFRAKKVSLTRI